MGLDHGCQELGSYNGRPDAPRNLEMSRTFHDSGWSSHGELRRGLFLWLLIVGALLRIASLPLPGSEDMVTWKIWTSNASTDVLGIYGVGGDPPERRLLSWNGRRTTVDYPPLALYELALVGRAYRLADPEVSEGWRLSAAIKVPGLIAGLALTIGLFVGVHRLTGRRAPAQWAALAFWLNPATIVNGEVLAYLDPLSMLPSVGAFLLAGLGWPAAAGAALAAGMATKPQGLLVAPALALLLWHAGGFRWVLRAATAGAATIVVVFLPYALTGALPNIWRAFGSFGIRRDILSGYAANLWWIVTWAARAWNMIPEFGFPGAYLEPVKRILAISSFMEMGLPNPRPIGAAMQGLAIGWAFWRLRRARDLGLMAVLAAFTVHAYFVLGVAVHEHHMMLAVPLLVLASAMRPAFRPICVAASLIAALNMNLFYGFGWRLGWAVPRTLTPIDLSVLLASVNVGVLVWFGRVLAREAHGTASGAIGAIAPAKPAGLNSHR